MQKVRKVNFDENGLVLRVKDLFLCGILGVGVFVGVNIYNNHVLDNLKDNQVAVKNLGIVRNCEHEKGDMTYFFDGDYFISKDGGESYDKMVAAGAGLDSVIHEQNEGSVLEYDPLPTHFNDSNQGLKMTDYKVPEGVVNEMRKHRDGAFLDQLMEMDPDFEMFSIVQKDSTGEFYLKMVSKLEFDSIAASHEISSYK